MTINQSILSELEMEMAGTRKVLERVPTDKFDFKPHPKSGTMIWLAGHVAMICDWGYTTLTTPSLTIDDFTPPPPPKTTEELVAAFDKSWGQFREALGKTSDEDMMHVWTMTWKGKQMMSMPRIAVLRGMIINHMIHHRGQLTMYLRACEIPVPGLYGPSADEPQPGI
ncbi:MAG: DinB family protein [Bryobacteraceae bacterium]|nr:DinB family protein [Bryobacteraceae bacterium]